MALTSEQTISDIEGLMEVIMHVKDMNAQVTFYREKLGLKLTYPADRVDFANENWVTFDTGSCIFVLHSGGRNRMDESPSHRIVFRVRDIQTARDQLVGRGVVLSEIRSPAPGVWVSDGKDPEGNVFALESHQST
jgi:predicted enzyme related to lactoylglutathione lyase